MNRAGTAILALVGTLFAACGGVSAGEQVPEKHLIVPGVGIGDFKLGMSKDDVLKKLGQPRLISWGPKEYTLDKLPPRYCLHYGHIRLEVNDKAVQRIEVHSPSYKFANGLGVGDSEEEVKQAFGEDCWLDTFEGRGKDLLASTTMICGGKGRYLAKSLAVRTSNITGDVTNCPWCHHRSLTSAESSSFDSCEGNRTSGGFFPDSDST